MKFFRKSEQKIFHLGTHQYKLHIIKLHDFCNLNDYELVDVLKDEGKSEMEFSKRDGYLELINRCKTENINGVVVYCLSRLGRRMKDIIDVMELFNKNDIEFYSVKENINNKDIMGKLMMNILMSFNEFEVDNIRERIIDVKRNNKENGLVYGKLMFGNDIEESIGDCDINHSLSITEDNITNKVFGDCESITNSDCSLSDLSNWSYSKNNNVLTLQLLESIDYCDDPNGVDNTSQSTQNIEFEFSITNGELRLIENMDEVYIYERI